MNAKRQSFRLAVHGRKRKSLKPFNSQRLNRLFFGVAGIALASGIGLSASFWNASNNRQPVEGGLVRIPDAIEMVQEDVTPVLAKGDRLKFAARVDDSLPIAENAAVYTPAARPAVHRVKTVSLPGLQQQVKDRPAAKDAARVIDGAAAIKAALTIPAEAAATTGHRPELAYAPATDIVKPKTKGGRIIAGKLGPVEVPGVWATYIRTPAQEKIYSETQYAALRTGVNPFFLQLVNRAESGHRIIGANTSSAAGPFQFIESTWLYALKTYGEHHGYKEFADAISVVDGEYRVKDKAKRVKVLALRNNDRAAAIMAGEYARENHAVIRDAFPKLAITDVHLYEGHFFGGGDVTKFIRGLLKTPNAAAASAFPGPARANHNIFYRHGKPLTYAQIHAGFALKMSENYRVEMPLVSEPKLDMNVATMTLADIKTPTIIKHVSTKKRAKLVHRGVSQPAQKTVSLFTLFRNKAEAQPADLPARYKKRAHHRAHAPSI